MPQTAHLFDHKHEIKLDFIGKLENFEPDCKIVAKTIGLKEFIPNIILNKSIHDPYQKYYTKDLEEICYQHYKIDFETLEYGRDVV